MCRGQSQKYTMTYPTKFVQDLQDFEPVFCLFCGYNTKFLAAPRTLECIASCYAPLIGKSFFKKIVMEKLFNSTLCQTITWTVSYRYHLHTVNGKRIWIICYIRHQLWYMTSLSNSTWKNNFFHSFNSSPSSVAYMHQWIGSAFAHIMACRLFGANLLSQAM